MKHQDEWNDIIKNRSDMMNKTNEYKINDLLYVYSGCFSLRDVIFISNDSKDLDYMFDQMVAAYFFDEADNTQKDIEKLMNVQKVKR